MLRFVPRYPRAVPRLSGFRSGVAASAIPQTGLDFPLTGVANSDVRFLLPVSVIPRVGHSCIWWGKLHSQPGYGAELAHCGSNISDWGVRPNGITYEYITCYHPCNGTYDSDGQRSDAGATGSAGTVQYFEIAGIGNRDYICSPAAANGAPTLFVPELLWPRFRSCRYITVSTTNDYIEHLFVPNLYNPSVYIRQLLPTAELVAPDGSGVLSVGSHRWTTYETNKNGEATGGVLTGFQFYGDYMSIAEGLLELGNPRATAVGAASLRYLNLNPTPGDITDKSGNGNHPTWETAAGNTLRPALWTA